MAEREERLDEKLMIVPGPDGNVRFSGEILKLEDRTVGRPTFQLFEHFARWIRGHNPKEQTLQLFYTGTTIKAYDVEDLKKYHRNVAEVARMDFTFHPVLERLKRGLGQNMEQDTFEKWIASLTRYLANDDARLLLLKVRDLQLTKKIQIEKKKTNTGFKMLIAMDDQNSEFQPPETVKIAVPLFKGLEARGTFQLDFHFGFEMISPESCKTFWKLESLTWEEDLLDITSQVIEESLQKADLGELPVFAGKVEVEKLDNSWEFLHNTQANLRKLAAS